MPVWAPSHSYLYKFIGLKSHRSLEKQLVVFNVFLECGNINITERHVVLEGINKEIHVHLFIKTEMSTLITHYNDNMI